MNSASQISNQFIIQHHPAFDIESEFAAGRDETRSMFGGTDFGQVPPRTLNQAKPRRALSISVLKDHFSKAIKVRRNSLKCHDRADRDQRYRDAVAWLSENRRNYLGKWVALQGGQLLAAGVTGKEVFAKVSNEHPAPLVVRVEDEELPFGGW